MTAWATAAGGRVEGSTVVLPAGLRDCLARAMLETHARIAGWTVAALTCGHADCPNDPLPSDTLCDHCSWLAGDRP